MPRTHVLPLQTAGVSHTRRRVKFLDNHLWVRVVYFVFVWQRERDTLFESCPPTLSIVQVTRYDPSQRHPAGEFPNQAAGPDGVYCTSHA